MINQTFQHCKGIGPVTEEKVLHAGFSRWEDILEKPDSLPVGGKVKDSLMQMTEQSIYALESDDIQFFVDSFAPSQHWRILDRYFSKASYFDIETTGFSNYESDISCIVCMHKGELHTFVRDKNLDDFLDLLEDVELLVSFNGTSFDVPFVVNSFHIPEIPCPHVDLRWICYHAGITGGLKSIEKQLNIQRPKHLQEVDGFEAIYLWENWKRYQDHQSLNKLIQYCQYDVRSLATVASKVMTKVRPKPEIHSLHTHVT
ncbi:MAG: ribonuclease H-like domain-containing protein [Fibrobacterales bacterium]